MKLAVLISGRGSNMLRLADHAAADPRLDIVLVAANKPCDGLGLATERGLATALVDRTAFDSKQAQETELGNAIVASGADMICLAGYMAILSESFVERFSGRIINIHPSLLPALKGLDTHARALAAGTDRHGASVHIVTAALDDGPILLQAGLEIAAGDNADTLADRVLQLEHALYPFVMSSLASGEVSLRDGTVAWQDGAAALASADGSISDRLRDTVIWPDKVTGTGQTRN